MAKTTINELLARTGTWVGVAAALLGCSQAGDEVSANTSASSAALGGVVACESASLGCFDAGTSAASACEGSLRACLQSLLADASVPAPVLVFDGGAGLAVADAGLRPPTLVLDAGAGLAPDLDAAVFTPPVIRDSGIVAPTPTPTPALDASQAANGSPLACTSALTACLLGAGSPVVCAEQARLCLTTVLRPNCDAALGVCAIGAAPFSCLTLGASCL
jgi:hypothetical protein